MKIRTFVLALGLVLALGVSLFALAARADGAPDASSRHAGGTTQEYVDVSGYLTADADINAWYTLVFNLRDDFDYICGDTFCEGEYTNIESLRYRCSVERTTGTIGSCVWVFAASNEEVSARTGRIIVDAQSWRCRTPLVRGTSIHDFLAALEGPSPLYAHLPGTNWSIYDGLANCL